MFLATVRRNLCLALVLFAMLLGQALPAMAHSAEKTKMESAPAMVNAATIQLTTEYDACSGQLYVKNSAGQWKAITRGVRTTVYVKVDSSGYWYWRCGSTVEKSRATYLANLVNMLQVVHSTSGRGITWYTYHY